MNYLYVYEKKRLRTVLFVIMSVIFTFALLSKGYTGPHRHWFKNYCGDILFVMFFYFFIKFIKPMLQWIWVAVLDYSCIALIEYSQKLDSPLLSKARDTYWGMIILGEHFDWRDLIYYAVGIILAAGIFFLLKCAVCIDRKNRPERARQIQLDL